MESHTACKATQSTRQPTIIHPWTAGTGNSGNFRQIVAKCSSSHPVHQTSTLQYPLSWVFGRFGLSQMVCIRKCMLSILEAFHLLNLFLLSTVSLTIASLNSSDYQKATIASVSLCFVVCLVTMAMHLWWNFNLKKIKRRLGFKDHQEYIPVPQVSANEDDEVDRPLLGSPPSIVYGSRRGEHQFELVFPDQFFL